MTEQHAAQNPGTIGFSFIAVPAGSALAHNITVAEETAAFCWDKAGFGSGMTSSEELPLISVDSLHELSAGGATATVSAGLKSGYCGSSCCCTE